MSKQYRIVRSLLFKGLLDLENDDLRLALLMTGTSAGQEEVNRLSDFSVLDEFDGLNYDPAAATSYQLTTALVSTDTVLDRAEFSADVFDWLSLGVGTRPVAGILLYKYSGSFASSVPIAFFDNAPFPLDPSGVTFTVNWNTEGILQISTPGVETPVKPDATNTGPTSTPTTIYTGSSVINEDTTITDSYIPFRLRVAPNITVTIQDCIITGQAGRAAIECYNGGTGMGTGSLVVQNCEIKDSGSGILGSGFTLDSCNIHDIDLFAVHPSGDQGATVQSNWIHRSKTGLNCGLLRQSLTIFANNFDLPTTDWSDGTRNPNGHGDPYAPVCCIRLRADGSSGFPGPVGPALIDNNWINGGIYSLELLNEGSTFPVTGVTLTNNLFGCDYQANMIQLATNPLSPIAGFYGNKYAHNSVNIDSKLLSQDFPNPGSDSEPAWCYLDKIGPSVSFLVDETVVQQGGGTQAITIFHDGDATEILRVNISLEGLAPGGAYDIQWPGGVYGQVFFDGTSTSKTISVTAYNGGATGVSYLTITDTDKYQLGTRFRTAITAVVEQDGTLLQFDGTGEATQLVQYAFPVDAGTIPTFYIDDQQADIFPVAWDANGLVDWVQVAAKINTPIALGEHQAQLKTTGSFALPGTVKYPTTDLTALTLEADIFTSGTMTAQLIEAADANLVQTLRNGKFIQEKVYFSQLTDGGDNILAIHTFVTRRADKMIELSIMVSNDVYDPTSALPTVAHAEVDGDVYFQSMKLTGIVTADPDLRVLADWEDASTDATALNVTDPEPILVADEGDMQVLPARRRFIRHLVLYPSAKTTAAAKVAAFGGYAVAHSGAYSHHARRGYGAQRDRLPKLDENFRYYSNQTGQLSNFTGYVAARRMSQDFWDTVVTNGGVALGAANVEYNFHAAQQGWFFPYGPAQHNEDSKIENYLRYGWHDNPAEWRNERLKASYTLQRHSSGLHHPDGRIVTPSDLRTVDTAKFDFSVTATGNAISGSFPHFIDANAVGDYGPPAAWQLKPSGNPWNGFAGTLIQTEVNVQPYWGGNSWSPYMGANLARMYHSLQPLAYLCNLGWVKWLLWQETAHVELALGKRLSDFRARDFDYASYNMARSIELSTTNSFFSSNGGWDGPHFPPLNGESDFRADVGHLATVLAEGTRLLSPSAVDQGTGTRRQNLSVWADTYAEWADYVLGPLGIGARYAYKVFEYETFPSRTDVFGGIDTVNREGVLTSAFFTAPAWGVAYSAFGAYAVETMFAPRTLNGPRTTVDDKLRQHMEGSVKALWESAEAQAKDTQPVGMYHYLVVDNLGSADPNINSEPPDETLATWYMGSSVVPETGLERGYLDYKSLTHIAIAIWSNIDTSVDPAPWILRLIRWINRFTVETLVETSTCGAINSALMRLMSDASTFDTIITRDEQYAYGVVAGAIQECIAQFGTDKQGAI